jgi:hypothetical protein
MGCGGSLGCVRCEWLRSWRGYRARAHIRFVRADGFTSQLRCSPPLL